MTVSLRRLRFAWVRFRRDFRKTHTTRHLAIRLWRLTRNLQGTQKIR